MISRVEKWGDSYRLIQIKTNGIAPRNRGRKEPYTHSLAEDEGEYWERRWDSENERLSASISRSRSRVKELAMCNRFEYFCTFTLAETKQDRFNLKAWIKDFGNWIGNYNKKYNTKLQYLIIPEQHKNGAWHAHGLIKGIAAESTIINKHGYLEIPYYTNRFGFMNMSAIKHQGRCATYVSKYITKDVKATATALGKWAHTFYASRDLEGKQVLWQGTGDFKADYECNFCKIAWVGFKTAMEFIGRSLLLLKEPHHTIKYTISKILNLEEIYNNEDSELSQFRGNRMLHKDSCGMALASGAERKGSLGSDEGLHRRRGNQKAFGRGERTSVQSKGVLFQPMDETRYDGLQLRDSTGESESGERARGNRVNVPCGTPAEQIENVPCGTPAEQIENADKLHNERVRRLQDKIAYSTSQGTGRSFFDWAHRQNHGQLTFFRMDSDFD